MAGAMDWEGQTAGRGPGGGGGAGVCGNGLVQVATQSPLLTTLSDKSEPGAEGGGGLPPSPAAYQDSCESWLASAWVGGYHQVEPKACSPTKEWSGAVKEFESSLDEIEAGLQNIARKLETKATNIAVAMKDLQWVWDELDSWHQRMALLEAAMQDFEGQHPEGAPGLGDAAFSLAQLYNVLRSQAEHRTAKLRRAESLMEQYESRRAFVRKWVNTAQAVSTDDVSAHRALLEQSREVLAGLEAMVECVDALSEVCSVERMVQQVSELDQRTTVLHGWLQDRLRCLWGPSEDELVAMGADFQLLQDQLSSPALGAFGHEPQLVLRTRLLSKLGALAEQLCWRPRPGTYSALRDAVAHLHDATEQQCAALRAALAKAEWCAGETRRLQSLIAETEEKLWILGVPKHGDSPRLASRRLALARKIRGYWEGIADLTIKVDLVKRRSRHSAVMRKSRPPLGLPPLVEAEEEWESDERGINPPAGCCSPSKHTGDASLDQDIARFQALTPEDILSAVERIMQERGDLEPQPMDPPQAADLPPPSPLTPPSQTPTQDRGWEEDPTAKATTVHLDAAAGAAEVAASSLPTAGALPELADGKGLVISRCAKREINDNSPTRTVPSPSSAIDDLTQLEVLPLPPLRAPADACGNGADSEPAHGRQRAVAGGGADEPASVEQRATPGRTNAEAQKPADSPAPSSVAGREPDHGDAGLPDDADGGEVKLCRGAAVARGEPPAEVAGPLGPPGPPGPPGPGTLEKMCEDFEKWLEQLEHRVSARDSAATLAFPQMRDELSAFVAVQHEVQQGLTHLEGLKVQHRKLLCSGDPAVVATLRPRVQACNHRWVGLKKAVAALIKTLRVSRRALRGAVGGVRGGVQGTDGVARRDGPAARKAGALWRVRSTGPERPAEGRIGEEAGDAGLATEAGRETREGRRERGVGTARAQGGGGPPILHRDVSPRHPIPRQPPDSGEDERSPPETSGPAHVIKPVLSGEPNGPSCCESQSPRPLSNRQPQETRAGNQPPPPPSAVISGSVFANTSPSPLESANSPAGRRDYETLAPPGDVACPRRRPTASAPVEEDAPPRASELLGEAPPPPPEPARHGDDSPASWESLACAARSASDDVRGGGASAGTPAEPSFARESPSFSLDRAPRPARACEASRPLSLQWDGCDWRAEPAGGSQEEISFGLTPNKTPLAKESHVVRSGASGRCRQDDAQATGYSNEGKRIFTSAVEDVGVWMDLPETPAHHGHVLLRKKGSTAHVSQLQKQSPEPSCLPMELSCEQTGPRDDDDDLAHLLEQGEEPWPPLCEEMWWRVRSSPWRWRPSGWRCRWLDICRALRALRPLPRLVVVMLAATSFLLWAGCFSIGGVPRLPPS